MNRIVLACALLLIVSSANARGVQAHVGQNYFGLSAMSMWYKDDPLSQSARMVGGMAKVGRDFNRYFSVEGQAGTTGSKSVNVSGTPRDVQVDYFVSLLARGNLRFQSVTLYGLAGVTYAKGSSGSSAIALDTSKTAFSYGAGIELYGNRTTAIDLEAMRYQHTSDYNIDAVSLGFVHHF